MSIVATQKCHVLSDSLPGVHLTLVVRKEKSSEVGVSFRFLKHTVSTDYNNRIKGFGKFLFFLIFVEGVRQQK